MQYTGVVAEARALNRRYTEFKPVGSARVVLCTQEKVRRGPNRSWHKALWASYVRSLCSFFPGGSLVYIYTYTSDERYANKES